MSRRGNDPRELIINNACKALLKWHDEGRTLEGYEREKGRLYLAAILDFPPPSWDEGYQETFMKPLVERGGLKLCEQLAGPHGWAMLQAFLARKRAKEESELKARQKHRARIRELLENDPTARFE